MRKNNSFKSIKIYHMDDILKNIPDILHRGMVEYVESILHMYPSNITWSDLSLKHQQDILNCINYEYFNYEIDFTPNILEQLKHHIDLSSIEIKQRIGRMNVNHLEYLDIADLILFVPRSKYELSTFINAMSSRILQTDIMWYDRRYSVIYKYLKNLSFELDATVCSKLTTMIHNKLKEYDRTDLFNLPISDIRDLSLEKRGTTNALALMGEYIYNSQVGNIRFEKKLIDTIDDLYNYILDTREDFESLLHTSDFSVANLLSLIDDMNHVEFSYDFYNDNLAVFHSKDAFIPKNVVLPESIAPKGRWNSQCYSILTIEEEYNKYMKALDDAEDIFQERFISDNFTDFLYKIVKYQTLSSNLFDKIFNQLAIRSKYSESLLCVLAKEHLLNEQQYYKTIDYAIFNNDTELLKALNKVVTSKFENKWLCKNYGLAKDLLLMDNSDNYKLIDIDEYTFLFFQEHFSPKTWASVANKIKWSMPQLNAIKHMVSQPFLEKLTTLPLNKNMGIYKLILSKANERTIRNILQNNKLTDKELKMIQSHIKTYNLWDEVIKTQSVSDIYILKHIKRFNPINLLQKHQLDDFILDKYFNILGADNIAKYVDLNENFLKQHPALLQYESTYMNFKNNNLSTDLMIDLIRQYPQHVNWEYISKHCPLSKPLLEEYHDKLNYKTISQYQDMTKDMIISLKDKIDFEIFFDENPAKRTLSGNGLTDVFDVLSIPAFTTAIQNIIISEQLIKDNIDKFTDKHWDALIEGLHSAKNESIWRANKKIINYSSMAEYLDKMSSDARCYFLDQKMQASFLRSSNTEPCI